MPAFDIEALLRAVLIGIGIGLVTGMIGYFVTRPKPDRPRRNPVLIMGGFGIALLASVAAYILLPSRSTIPILDNLSQTEAEDLLKKHKLVPSPRPLYAGDIPAGRVIPHSQSPIPGLLVANASVVTFGVSQQLMIETSSSLVLSHSGTPDVQLFEPKDGEKLKCLRAVGGIGRCSISGVSRDISGWQLLLWVQPINPPSEAPGWYLQRPPANGIKRMESDGTWNGTVQIGDTQYTPSEGDQVDVAVSILASDEAKRLLAETGIVIRDQPQGIKVRIAARVGVTFR